MTAILGLGARAGLALMFAAAAVLAACTTTPPGENGAAVDAAYGIPPGAVPPYQLRPDGLLINGLLPLPPNSGS